MSDNAPLLILGDSARLPEKEMEKQKKLQKKAKKSKMFFVVDSDNGEYIQYKAELKRGVSFQDIRRVHNVIDQMILSTRMSGVQVLQERKAANDLKNIFNEMLYSKVICFDKLTEVYNSNIKNEMLIEEPVKVFLELFDIKRKKGYTQQTFEEKIKKASWMKEKSWATLKSSVKSAPYNTILLRNIKEKMRPHKSYKKK